MSNYPRAGFTLHIPPSRQRNYPFIIDIYAGQIGSFTPSLDSESRHKNELRIRNSLYKFKRTEKNGRSVRLKHFGKKGR